MREKGRGFSVEVSLDRTCAEPGFQVKAFEMVASVTTSGGFLNGTAPWVCQIERQVIVIYRNIIINC